MLKSLSLIVAMTFLGLATPSSQKPTLLCSQNGSQSLTFAVRRVSRFLVVQVEENPRLENVSLCLSDSVWIQPVQSKRGTWTFETDASAGKFVATRCVGDACEFIEYEFDLGASLHYTLALALVVGVLMNFMPCVLPVIGLKLSAFSKPGKRSAYVLGVLLSFIGLATLAVTVGAGLSHMSVPVFRATLCLVCAIMSAHLLGLWRMPSLPVPGASKAGPFLTGVLTVGLGSSCSVPFLAPVLMFCAKAPVIEVYLIFMAMGVGFCAPFFLPIWRWIDRSGAYSAFWVERICGFALLLIACWLASTLPIIAVMIVVVLMVLFIGIILVLALGQMEPGYMLLGYCVLLFATCALMIPKPKEGNALVDYTGAMAVSVSADWCLNCKIVDPIWRDAEVQDALREAHIPFAHLDWTNGDPEVTRFLNEHDHLSVPFVLVVNRNGQTTKLSGLYTKADVLRAIEKTGRKNARYSATL